MADKEKANIPETDEGTIVFNVPFPDDLSGLKKMTPIIIKQPYQIDYIHSYGQDSPFFAGLANKKLLGTKCTRSAILMQLQNSTAWNADQSVTGLNCLSREGSIHGQHAILEAKSF